MTKFERILVEEAQKRFLGKTFLVSPEIWHHGNVAMSEPPHWHPECGFLAVCTSVLFNRGQLHLLTEHGQAVKADRCVTLEEYLARSGAA